MSVNWVKSTEVWVNSFGSLNPLVAFASTVDPQSQYIPFTFQWGEWCTVDLTQYGVDADAVWADIGGIAFITGGGELQMLCRGVGSSDDVYDQQALSWSSSGGDRSVLFDTVPLSQGKFQLRGEAFTYPLGGTLLQVGFNLKLKKWGR